LNSTTTFLGVVGMAIIGPLVLAAVIAGVMTWLSRQVAVGAAAAPEAALAKARSIRPPAGKPASPAATVAAPVTAVEPVAAPEVETFVDEAAGLEKEETHHRLVPLWLAVVYAVVIVWALIYILMEVVPFFRPLTPQSAPAVAPAATSALAAPQALTYSGQGNAANGEKLFASQGCAACHSLKEGEKIIGPSLFHVGQTALGRIKDTTYKGKATTAEEYIRESIVEPNTYVVPGFPAGVMVQDFGQKLSAQDIDDLIAFLMTR
jgi:cytochrome c2